mgnify:FL=1
MLEIALTVAKGALMRDEFRGSHYKPKFPKRNDLDFLKTTIATYDPHGDEPEITYKPVDIRHLEPVLRDYTKAKKVTPNLKNVPKKVPLVTEADYGRG